MQSDTIFIALSDDQGPLPPPFVTPKPAAAVSALKSSILRCRKKRRYLIALRAVQAWVHRPMLS
jgi:hypothetical protein